MRYSYAFYRDGYRDSQKRMGLFWKILKSLFEFEMKIRQVWQCNFKHYGASLRDSERFTSGMLFGLGCKIGCLVTHESPMLPMYTYIHM